ncbi:MAG: tRNA (N(6)-L-threonylcarbamoyladenosine(37)-C(2))-methylthiotransferase MtaB [Bdellovibrio sp.]|nr:tRNA (N(6)-L-threonylcarbamoyladenosine(37)-C(2))-methylthiotransferase MtaB [Bdellovibrio sp.]
MDHVDVKTQASDFVVHTFGCKVNTYDSGLIQKNLKQNSTHTLNDGKESAPAKIHILNTCAVTSEATQQAVRMIRKIKSTQPFSTIVVTGCAAQVDTDSFKNLPGADLVVANSHKGLLPQILDQYFKGEVKDKVFKSNIFHKEELEADGGTENVHTRSFLKIQDGCNSFCTFCIIPYARGKSRSIPIQILVQKIKELEAQDIKEVVLTGVHIGDYEDQVLGQKKYLEDLVEAVLQRTTIGRIRLSSLEPIEVSPRLLELYSNPRLCPHFHMSIQSADTEVLAGMKRKYTSEQVQDALHKISEKVPGVFVGMDVIAGFPTETDEQFENTYKVLAETPWTRLHVFPYSERTGTRAVALKQIPFHKRKERAARLRELSLHRHQSEALKHVGTVKQTLIFNTTSTKTDGLSHDYWPVKLDLGDQDRLVLNNQVRAVKIYDVQLTNSDVILLGRLVHAEN